jgi:hypothetical protein
MARRTQIKTESKIAREFWFSAPSTSLGKLFSLKAGEKAGHQATRV